MKDAVILVNQAPAKQSLNWKFLGGLIDVADLEGESFEAYTDLQKFRAFRLKQDKVGFSGGIGLKEYTHVLDEAECLELVLWPYMPAQGTPQGYIDVFDPKPVLKLIWKYHQLTPEENSLTAFKRIEVELKSGSLNSFSTRYALKLLQRAQEIWPWPETK